MKKSLFAFSLMLSVISASQASTDKQVADCYSSKDQIRVCVYKRVSGEWKSFDVYWGNIEDCATSSKPVGRSFINQDIKEDSDKAFEGKEGGLFLGFGEKTKFSINKIKGTAKIKGFVGMSLELGDGPFPQEEQGRFKYNFDQCKLTF